MNDTPAEPQAQPRARTLDEIRERAERARGWIAPSNYRRDVLTLLAEVDKWRSIADDLATVLSQGFPAANYVKWQRTGDAEASDRLNAYGQLRSDALARYREAVD